MQTNMRPNGGIPSFRSETTSSYIYTRDQCFESRFWPYNGVYGHIRWITNLNILRPSAFGYNRWPNISSWEWGRRQGVFVSPWWLRRPRWLSQIAQGNGSSEALRLKRMWVLKYHVVYAVPQAIELSFPRARTARGFPPF